MLLLESELETQQAEALAKAEVDATARQLAEELQASGGQPPPAATEDVTLPESPESSESPATPVGQVGQVPPVAAAPVVEPEDGPTPEERALLEADLADLPPPSVTASDDDSVAAAATSDGESAASDEHAAAADDSATAEESKADKSAKKKKKDKKSKGGKASEAAAAEDEGNADAVNHPPARSVGAVAGDLSVGALRVMAAILELVDRPFRGLSPDTRDLLGKMAIATFLAAILITIVALLRM